MTNGIALAEWFAGEAKRAYAMLSESDEDRDRRRLVEWIERRGGTVTVRDLTHGPNPYRGHPDEAETALRTLIRAGYGRMVDRPPGKMGGRPTACFELSAGCTGTKTPKNPDENEVLVPVHDVNGENDEWGGV